MSTKCIILMNTEKTYLVKVRCKHNIKWKVEEPERKSLLPKLPVLDIHTGFPKWGRFVEGGQFG